jgi:hypothetical protein
MLVKANAMGFYDGKRRREGDVFEVKDGIKSKWFDPVSKGTKPEVKVVEKEKPKALSELGKEIGSGIPKAL